MSSLHDPDKYVVAGAGTAKVSDAHSDAPTPATTPTAAPGTASPVEQPDAGPVPPTGPASTFDPDKAREAAALSAFPDDRHGTKTGTIWGTTPVTIVGVPTGPDMSWSDGTGNCTGVNPDVFFPARGEDAAAAKAICVGCPLLGPCREHGIANETIGIWGGMSERERRLERARRGGRQIGRPVGAIIHGTRSGYGKHRRLPEIFGEPCDACREAMSRDMRARRAKRVTGDVTGAEIIDIRRGA